MSAWSGLAFSAPEQQCYLGYFRSLDSSGSGRIAGPIVVNFLSTSGLDRNLLHQIWGIADGRNSGSLTAEDFGVAMRLVAHVQAGKPVSPNLAQMPPPQPPRFGGGPPGSALAASAAMVSPQDMRGRASRSPVRPVASVPTPSELRKYARLFMRSDRDGDCRLTMDEAREIFQRSGLGGHLLGHFWDLIDMNRNGTLSFPEFVGGMHLISHHLHQVRHVNQASPLPSSLPPELRNFLGGLHQGPAELAAQGSRSRSASPRSLSPAPSARGFSTAASTRSLGPGRSGALLGPLPTDKELRKYARLYQRTDADGDALLSMEEATVVFALAGIERGDAEKIFDFVDVYQRRRLAFPEFAAGVHLAGRARAGLWNAAEAAALPPEMESYMFSIRHSAEELARDGSSRAASVSRSRPTSPAPSGPLRPLPSAPGSSAALVQQLHFGGGASSLLASAKGASPKAASPKAGVQNDPWTGGGGGGGDDWGGDWGGGATSSGKGKNKKDKSAKDGFDDPMTDAAFGFLADDGGGGGSSPSRARSERAAGSPRGGGSPAPSSSPERRGSSGRGRRRGGGRGEDDPPQVPVKARREEPTPPHDPDSWKRPSTRLGLPVDLGDPGEDPASAAGSAGGLGLGAEGAGTALLSGHGKDPHFEARIREILGNASGDRGRPAHRTSIEPMWSNGLTFSPDLAATGARLPPTSTVPDIEASSRSWMRSSRNLASSPVMQGVLMGTTPLLPASPRAPPSASTLQPGVASTGSLSAAIPASGFLSAIRPNFRVGGGGASAEGGGSAPAPPPPASASAAAAAGGRGRSGNPAIPSTLAGALRVQLAALTSSYRPMDHAEDNQFETRPHANPSAGAAAAAAAAVATDPFRTR
mmetsp:Transcript_51495/g.167042  ORF Transcript_51495/g.167042 Transcript_51495/m.167042 type:complete len:871 (-) Transcript_51495:64-2676(-)